MSNLHNDAFVLVLIFERFREAIEISLTHKREREGGQ